MALATRSFISLDLQRPIWDHFFTVAPLVVVGTREPDGRFDLAPKHLAMPLGWDNYFGFVCTPKHCTYQNIVREKGFTVSFLRPDRVLEASLAAAPRDAAQQKPALQALPTRPATQVEGVLLEDAYLWLECELLQIVDGFGDNSLIAGTVVAAQVAEDALRVSDQDDQDVLQQAPLLAYLPPGRYARIDQSFSFPFHAGFHR